MITRQNYEKYVIDFLEGTLDDGLQQEFEMFLKENLDIANEIFEIQDIRIDQISSSLTNREKLNLKKSSIDGLSYFDQLCISDIEGNISDDNKKVLSQLINEDQNLAEIYFQYKKTKLRAPKVFYPYKKQLYKHKVSKKVYWAVAAVVIILFNIVVYRFYTNLKSEYLLAAEGPNFEYIIRQSVNNNAYVDNEKIVYNKSQFRQKNKKRLTEDTVSTKIRLQEDFYITNIQPRKIESIIEEVNTEVNINSLRPEITEQLTLTMVLNEIAEKAFENFQKASTKRGIKFGRNQISITIGDKQYGIAWR